MHLQGTQTSQGHYMHDCKRLQWLYEETSAWVTEDRQHKASWGQSVVKLWVPLFSLTRLSIVFSRMWELICLWSFQRKREMFHLWVQGNRVWWELKCASVKANCSCREINRQHQPWVVNLAKPLQNEIAKSKAHFHVCMYVRDNVKNAGHYWENNNDRRQSIHYPAYYTATCQKKQKNVTVFI